MTDQLTGCPGCGLFLRHVPGCRGVVASYWRYHRKEEADGFQTVEEATRFLEYGAEEGSFAPEAVLLPDGTVAARFP